MECKCDRCCAACERKPGWFKPGEVGKAAAHLGMDVKDFFNKYVGVDWWENGSIEMEPTYVLAPATVAGELGKEYPYSPNGTCVFFKEGKCQIHAVKPEECRFFDHEKQKEECQQNKLSIANAWAENQKEIEDLLGRKPHREMPSLSDLFDLFFA